MINPGDIIWVDDNGKMYSKFFPGRLSYGQSGVDNDPIKEGTKLMISITKKGIKEVERLIKEKK